jgi:hypothetical protein
MAILTKFSPPANIGDFDQNPSLKDDWNKFISDTLQEQIKSLSDPPLPNGDGGEGVPPEQVCFFDPRKQPPGQATTVSVMWRGFPNVLTAKFGKEDAYKRADEPVQNIRIQDEYLEWVVRRDDATGKIKEIIFTCEGPEYWERISQDKDLLLQLYRKYASPEVKLSDLLSSNGTYKRNNKWNMSAAIHLTHPANTLGAEINIAVRTTVLRGSGTPISNDHALICCGAYGVVNRNSDPKIGATVNAAVRDGNWVSLRDPIALYISDIDSSQFTKPDGSAITDFTTRYWNVIRGSADDGMILRASLKVPEDEMFENKPLLLGDLLISGDPLLHGGQVADTIDVGLYATIVPGAPKATPIACRSKCCQDRNFPNTDTIVDVEKDCASPQVISAAADFSPQKSGTRSFSTR